MSRHLPRRAAALVSMLAVTAGCTHVVGGTAVAPPPAPAVGAAIAWQPCTKPAAPLTLPAGAECGTLAVPVDYAAPAGERASLAVIRIPATGNKIGSLVINPGGPGGSGVEAAISMHPTFPPALLARFDLVGFDPRGVGESTPAIRCNSDEDTDRERQDPGVDYSPAGVADADAKIGAFVQRCVDKMGTAFLANVGTVNVAKDLDLLRAALGDEKLTYLGYSYGTAIGSSYAEQFPQHVRALVLDGAVDPNLDPLEAGIRQAAGFQRAFEDFARDCAAAGQCPIGDDPANATETFKQLVAPLVQKPAPTSDGRGLSYSDAITATKFALYSKQLWTPLYRGLQSLRAGTGGDDLLLLADAYLRRDQSGHYDNLHDAFVAISCVDNVWPTDRAAWVEADRRSREVEPFSAYGEFTGHAPIGACGRWPVPPTSRPGEVSAPGLPTVLVVSTTNDPATPYTAGVELARQLGGVLLTYEGTQHLAAYQSDACIDDKVTAYLIDLTLPPPGTRCA
ncbi:alpha/beta hydrolase [Mycobacterium sp. MYCO198283]|nr:alpha/beta hydrolase [Mycobacterium sp. MYCO198283]MCG5432662.1 alpha/beta hydrolase [Mycobacterium sp. MYCO198283]